MVCLNCKSDKLEFWSSVYDEEYGTLVGQKFDYYSCHSCKTLSIGKTFENQLNEIYPQNYYSFESNNYNLLYKIKFAVDAVFYKRISKKFGLPESVNVLDIGGGTGEVLKVFEKSISTRRFSGTVIDLDQKVQPSVSGKGYELICDSFLTHDFADTKYDVLIALNILEHVSDPNLFLRQCFSILNSGGLVIIQTPNWQSLDARLFRHRYWGGLHAPRHFVIFGKQSMRAALLKAGFKIEAHRDAPAGPFWTWSILGSFRSERPSPKKPLHKSPFFPVLAASFTAFDIISSCFRSTSQQFIVAKKE